MIRNLLLTAAVTIAGLGAVSAQGASKQAVEDYAPAPMPPGFQVIATELDGPVFADSRGRTLYKWPKKALRSGEDAGDSENKPTCDNRVYRTNAGLMTPYPGGFELPEVETRPSCADAWPPVLADEGARPVGKWTIVSRPDGLKQWAYDKWPLYTSALDKRPGDVLGGSTLFDFAEAGALRYPVAPDPNIPSQFRIHSTMAGRLVTVKDGWSVYASADDRRHKSNCADACLQTWEPILAAAYARAVGEWTTFERAAGVRQWAFRGMPVYRYRNDSKLHAQDGGDVPGWRNVYTQAAPDPPKDLSLKVTSIGLVLGDKAGRTIYRYICTDDAYDQLACDHPDTPQAYRFTVCGGGSPERCVKAFPYVLAPAGAKSANRTWSTMYIDPETGRRTANGQAGALHVWTFRDRPVYTFADDKKPHDLNAHSWGEFNGTRNGFKAAVYRDMFSNRDID